MFYAERSHERVPLDGTSAEQVWPLTNEDYQVGKCFPAWLMVIGICLFRQLNGIWIEG